MVGTIGSEALPCWPSRGDFPLVTNCLTWKSPLPRIGSFMRVTSSQISAHSSMLKFGSIRRNWRDLNSLARCSRFRNIFPSNVRVASYTESDMSTPRSKGSSLAWLNGTYVPLKYATGSCKFATQFHVYVYNHTDLNVRGIVPISWLVPALVPLCRHLLTHSKLQGFGY